MKILVDNFNTRVRYNLRHQRMFKENCCNIYIEKIILSTFYAEERKYSELGHFCL